MAYKINIEGEIWITCDAEAESRCESLAEQIESALEKKYKRFNLSADTSLRACYANNE